MKGGFKGVEAAAVFCVNLGLGDFGEIKRAGAWLRIVFNFLSVSQAFPACAFEISMSQRSQGIPNPQQEAIKPEAPNSSKPPLGTHAPQALKPPGEPQEPDREEGGTGPGGCSPARTRGPDEAIV